MREDTSPTPGVTNLLEHSASSYLRSARHQPVHWHPWGDAAFALAQSEDKPILLDIGAVWCHWCHVMDRESYENPQIASLINELFIAVKVDRDERPDVDARYQAAVGAITGQGGWPLTAFLTPDGRPYFGCTYIPPDDHYGRPGFERVLTTLAQVWRERRNDALENAANTMAAIEQNESFAGHGGQLSLELVDKIVSSILRQFDPRNGGFGSQPKFPHASAMDLLLHVGTNRNREPSSMQAAEKLDPEKGIETEGGGGFNPRIMPTESRRPLAPAELAFATTLEKMARGGVYDQLAGGFHRYSVDERWRVPHFEKMLYDNTELLRSYLHGFQSLAREDFRRIAEEIAHWLLSTMSDRDLGGFYASQDADINLDDDGDYFTWTLAEARSALLAAKFSSDDIGLTLRYWDIGELGDMHHDPARNVLHLDQSIEELAAETNQNVDHLRPLLAHARATLLAARAQRPTPFIDRTLYTGWNAMAVTACLEAARILKIDAVREFALLTLNRLLREAWDGNQSLSHVIAYGDKPVGAARPPDKVPGTLDDYAFTIHACIDAWLASGEMSFYHAAVKLADAMIALFHDSAAGAFYDTANLNVTPLGALSARRKPLQDSPTPAGNPTAASALLRLESLSGRADYRQIADETLASFAGVVEHFGLYAGSYGLALERLLLDPVQVVVIGSGLEAESLEAQALSTFAVNRTVIRIAPERLLPEGLPPALEETLLHAPRPEGAMAWAIVCRGHTCLPPITDAKKLSAALLNPIG